MSDTHLEKLRHPIGRFAAPAEITEQQLNDWIAYIEAFPVLLAAAVSGLDDAALDTSYREGGWTIRQVVHHLADSHMNSYVRFRLAVTEENPTIKPYDEAAWAELFDANTAPVGISLDLLTALHARWVLLLRSLTREQFRRAFRHPENGDMALDYTAGLYSWHGRHHLAHIAGALRKVS